MPQYVSVTTACVVGALGVAQLSAEAFVSAPSAGRWQAEPRVGRFGDVESQPLPQAAAPPSSTGLVAYGVGFGAVAAMLHSAGSRRGAGRSAMKAAESEIAVKEKEKGELSKVAYLKNIPRTIMEAKLLDKILAMTPKEKWEDPDEDSYLYTLKMYAETYGPGKATKMGWWDYYSMKLDMPGDEDIPDLEDIAEVQQEFDWLMDGKMRFGIPGPAGIWYNGALIQYKGKEPFAGDQIVSILTDGSFGRQYVENMAFYREGLRPWQRGIEIGMAHGYFLIGPFVSLGPLRNTPEAATVGLLCGCAIVGIVSIGGLIFGATIKPTLFDKAGDRPASGFNEMINWHAVGGLGGAGFAHALLTVFGSAA
ncbi:unnamed protein product [Polarella glacialis]|uniref:PSI subunit V n=1 Tax=Polarella glacialis TaxID=89957 RepID=A0A813GDQ3_POLGL|nr:unnamed protein product [Polarella glacialis]